MVPSMKRLVVGVDGSSAVAAALRWAGSLAVTTHEPVEWP